MKSILLIAALAAAVPQQSARAQDDALVTVSEAVGHADLDLATAQGASTLAARMRSAAGRACGPTSDFDLEGRTAARRCVAKALREARKAGDRLAAARRSRPGSAAKNAQEAVSSRAAPAALHRSEQ
ncbi:MAG TPA: UrcA family protein [Sphingomonadaceae bacterium]|nr:UrcA family protein [Sphingomonadaceae bacterium]